MDSFWKKVKFISFAIRKELPKAKIYSILSIKL